MITPAIYDVRARDGGDVGGGVPSIARPFQMTAILRQQGADVFRPPHGLETCVFARRRETRIDGIDE